jgi:hypothetical protein
MPRAEGKGEGALPALDMVAVVSMPAFSIPPKLPPLPPLFTAYTPTYIFFLLL